MFDAYIIINSLLVTRYGYYLIRATGNMYILLYVPFGKSDVMPTYNHIHVSYENKYVVNRKQYFFYR